MPMSCSKSTPITSLQAPQTAKSVKHFTLTTKAIKLNVGAGKTVDAWTYNGIAPGPTLRVRQGDLVVVKLVNTLPEGVTIHWHGVTVPNAADGVAGVTQDAVKQGQSYTYRFLAKDPGTYWYHSHEQSDSQVQRGLFGMLIVDPSQPTERDDVDAAITLHDWTSLGGGITINDAQQVYRISAKAGDWVRLRLLNTANNPLGVTLIGAPFTVSALDGHDLNKPQSLQKTLLPIGGGQRFDVRFRMPEVGMLRLVVTNEQGNVLQAPTALIGPDGAVPPGLPASLPLNWFDFSHYGEPRADNITVNSHFGLETQMVLERRVGFFNGNFYMTYTINGQTFPNIPPIVVQPGQLVKIRIVDESVDPHPIHIHGHTFTVLSRNGHPLTGSPVHLDTILVQPNESYEVAFRADNPGLWMDHCHNLNHAARGMSMMIVYPNISTPFEMGKASGNMPE
ncbi:MAG: multicopper oxidase family protein [Ktedonobacteraceae bacterium]